MAKAPKPRAETKRRHHQVKQHSDGGLGLLARACENHLQQLSYNIVDIYHPCLGVKQFRSARFWTGGGVKLRYRPPEYEVDALAS
jgi:hypothetical protein